MGIDMGSQPLEAASIPELSKVAQKHVFNAEAWGEMVGVDIAIFQEVIEHLDPAPLEVLPSCLLGALQPRILAVSTPNFEYNPVLHMLSSQLLPNSLRNSDHRFEWYDLPIKPSCTRAIR